MSDNKRKMTRLEQQAAAVGRGGWLSVTHKWGDPPGIYYDLAGNPYTDDDLARLEPTLAGIYKITWTDSEPRPGERVIQMSWGDDDEA